MLKYFIIILLLVLPSLTCNNNPVIPDDVKPGRRDYVWTIDTLPPQPLYLSIWGSTPQNVYTCGPGGGDFYEAIQHFDGEKWSNITELVFVEPYCIFGFSENNIWIGGNDGIIFHYDGSSWQNVFTFRKEGQYSSNFTDIWGDSPTNIYATGIIISEDGVNTNDNKGFLLHYNGIIWQEILLTDFGIQFQRVRNEGGNVFLRGVNNYTNTPGWEDSIFFYKYSRGVLSELFKNSVTKVGFANLNNIGDKIYFLIGKDLYRYVEIKNGFSKILTFPIEQSLNLYNVYGRNEKDIFISARNALLHFNGENSSVLFNYDPPIVVRKGVFFDDEVFFLVNCAACDNYIYRGKLTNQGGKAK